MTQYPVCFSDPAPDSHWSRGVFFKRETGRLARGVFCGGRVRVGRGCRHWVKGVGLMTGGLDLGKDCVF